MSEVVSMPQFSQTALSMLGLSVVMCVMIPLISVIAALVKIRKTVMPLLFGIVLYISSQLVIISPIGTLFLTFTGLGDAYQSGKLYANIPLAFLIAILEETLRFVCLAYMMKSYRKRTDAMMFGIGYGAISMLIGGGLPAFNDLVTATAINSGAVAELDAAAQESFITAANSMTQLPGISFLMTGFDQACIAIMSVALAVLMMEGINANNKRMIAVTMTVRVMALCCPILVSSLWKWGFFTASAFLITIAVFSIWYLVKTKAPDPMKPNFRHL